MNTKKAIEFCEGEIQEYGAVKHLYGIEKFPLNKPVITAYKSIIKLLKQGGEDSKELKKCRQIVKSIQWHIKASKKHNTAEYSFLAFIEGIIEKYFPKEAKRGSYFYECTSEEIYHLKKIPY